MGIEVLLRTYQKFGQQTFTETQREGQRRKTGAVSPVKIGNE